jgi:hypothetical protein
MSTQSQDIASRFAELDLADPEVGILYLHNIMERVGCQARPAEFLRLVNRIYRAAQKTLRVPDASFAHNTSHAIFRDALAEVSRRISRPARILVAGCGDYFAGCDAEYAARVVQNLIPEKTKSIHTWNLTYADLAEPGKAGVKGQYDLLVTHSLLHFIAGLGGLLRCFSGLLVPGGMYLMAHEPNARFWLNRPLADEGRRILAAWTADDLRHRFFKLSTYLEKAKKMVQGPPMSLESRVNQGLAQRFGVGANLTALELARIVDPHRPPNGGGEDGFRIGLNGFDRENLSRCGWDALPAWIRTYSHLGGVDCAQLPKKWKQRYSELETLYPDDGAFWTAVWIVNPR